MISKLEYDGMELDSQVKLLRFAYGLDNWKELIELSDTLYQDALRIYNLTIISEKQVAIPRLERPLIYYIGISKLMQGLAFQKMSDFDKSQKCIQFYSDWDWVKNPDEDTQSLITSFIHLANLNKRVLDILQGDNSQLNSYIEYIQQDKRELTAGLLTLLEANRMNKLEITSLEFMFANHVKDEIAKEILETDKPSYLKFLYEYSLYKMRDSNKYDAINTLLECLSIGAKLNTFTTSLIKYVYLFEKLREFATVEQVKRYQLIISEVVSDEEIEVGV